MTTILSTPAPILPRENMTKSDSISFRDTETQTYHTGVSMTRIGSRSRPGLSIRMGRLCLFPKVKTKKKGVSVSKVVTEFP